MVDTPSQDYSDYKECDITKYFFTAMQYSTAFSFCKIRDYA